MTDCTLAGLRCRSLGAKVPLGAVLCHPCWLPQRHGCWKECHSPGSRPRQCVPRDAGYPFLQGMGPRRCPAERSAHRDAGS
jgi:hypothetical protein